MKGKGKWAVFLLALGFAFAGCLGPSGSSDESAVNAADNPVMGTWQVTIDPSNESISIAPVTLGANSLEPAYSWTNQVIVTDLVNRSSASENPTLVGTTPVNLANGHIIPGSERVMFGTTKCVRGVDYVFNYGAGIGATVGSIARTGASVCPPSGGAVTVTYGYGSSANVVWSAPNFTVDIAVENHLNATIEKLRSWTGSTSGPGAADTPVLAAGYADYPNAVYGVPPVIAENVDGWLTGVCYATSGVWDSFVSPKIEGCKIGAHPKPGTNYAPSWIDPVCGRMVDTWRFSGTVNTYKFYMQLSGDVHNWSPDNYAFPGGADASFDKNQYSTWYAMMSYLVPDGAGLVGTWCSGAKTQVYWWAGSMIPIRPASSNHCGTLITDPHLPAKTYFAVNFGLEYANNFESQNATFWNTYLGTPDPDIKQGVGAPYTNFMGMGVIFDITKLNTYTVVGRTGHGGNTTFPGGFVDNNTTSYKSNDAVGFKKGPYDGTKVKRSTSYTPTQGWMVVGQYMGAAYADTNFSFFTSQTSPVQTGPMYTTAPYITQVTKCAPGPGMPRWAGQWGVAHYNNTCNLVVEGIDADLDYWFGMVVFRVSATAIPGDFAYVRFDAGGNNYLKWLYNNQDASNHPSHGGAASEDLSTTYCVQRGGGIAACPAGQNTSWLIYQGVELPNPDLPPGNAMGFSAFQTGCANGAWTCGGHQYVVASVCVQ